MWFVYRGNPVAGAADLLWRLRGLHAGGFVAEPSVLACLRELWGTRLEALALEMIFGLGACLLMILSAIGDEGFL